MAKDPHFPWYAQDFLVDVIQLDERLVGAYARLLSVMWINKFCLSDAESLLKISPSAPDLIKAIPEKFTFYPNGTFTSNRLEIERIKRNEIRELRSKVGHLGYQAKVKQKLSKHISKNQAKDNDNDKDKDKENKETKEEKKRVEKRAHGEFNNVFLTDEELQKLHDLKGPVLTAGAIEKISSYIEATGKKYRSHYAAIKNWGFRAAAEANQKDSLSRARGVTQRAIETYGGLDEPQTGL